MPARYTTVQEEYRREDEKTATLKGHGIKTRFLSVIVVLHAGYVTVCWSNLGARGGTRKSKIEKAKDHASRVYNNRTTASGATLSDGDAQGPRV